MKKPCYADGSQTTLAGTIMQITKENLLADLENAKHNISASQLLCSYITNLLAHLDKQEETTPDVK